MRLVTEGPCDHETTASSNLSDQRYVPFENAGAVSSWHFEMPAATNEIDVATVGDVILHLYYTALDGGSPLQAAAVANNAPRTTSAHRPPPSPIRIP